MLEVVGRFRILERVAAGGQATVYRAWDTGSGQVVALKVMHQHLAQDAQYVERFLREARMAASLEHPNVARVYDVGEEGGNYFIAMEYLPESLQRLLQSSQPVPVKQAVAMTAQVCRALAVAHGHGIVHRDIKPHNILLAYDGTVKVADFGIARALDLPTMTGTGMVMGTPQYMAPEQARGERVDGRADLYALGIVLYQLLTGHVPFEGNTPLEVIRKHLDTPVPPLPAEIAVPPEVERVLRRALEKDSDRRFQSAEEMALALGPVEVGPEVPPTTEPRPGPLQPPPPLPVERGSTTGVRERGVGTRVPGLESRIIRWQGRVGHPRQVGSAIKQTLEEEGFKLGSDLFKETPGALRDVASFEARVIGTQEMAYYSVPQAMLGMLLLPIILGWLLLKGAVSRPVVSIRITYEGEEYWAGAREADLGQRVGTERAGVISDCRVHLRGTVTWPRWRIFKNRKAMSELSERVERVLNAVELVLPDLRVSR